MNQEFKEIEYSEIPALAKRMLAGGYRMVQICGVTKEGENELVYSFDKDHEMVSYKVHVPFGTTIGSITPEYWAAFVYENEIHDLFGVEFTDSKLDYKGNFFRMSVKTPWKGAEKKDEGAA
ncbi:MAG: NADH-quinone oxidoreductase subunit C [Candidatus Methanomethylophilaceae archaeon]|nr:NADH-quinone oxidoreductase subunit C [Candidatus Methanomethylophilaceae archaeon]